MSRLIRAAAALVAAFALVGPASSDALSLQHRDDVQHGFRALTQTFYRGVEPAKLVAGARGGIAEALRRKASRARSRRRATAATPWRRSSARSTRPAAAAASRRPISPSPR